MSNDKMREEFEEAFHQARCQMICVAEDRPVAWAFFLASREAMVIELPEAYAWDNDGGFEKEYDPESECSMSLVPKIDVIIAIEAYGVKVKP